jgi:tetratricopeptide (TPR) repeat protein
LQNRKFVLILNTTFKLGLNNGQNKLIKSFLWLFFVSVCCAADLTGIDVQLDSIQNDLVAQQYKNAKDNLKRYLSINPSDVQALYLELAVCQTEILDYESYQIEGKQFLATADSIKKILEKKVTTLHGRDSLMCLFYLANVYGGISVMHAKTGSWIDGAKNGMTSVALLKQVQKSLPDFLAVYLGIGVFNYYFSTSLNWLPFTGSKCQEGLSYIEKAIKSEFPFNYAAKNSLCWILIDRQEYARADSVAVSVLNDYPGNTIFLRIRSIIDLRRGAFKGAIENANALLLVTTERSPVNWSDFITAYYILVESYYQSGLENESLTAAELILSKNIPQVYLSVPHIKKNLKHIKDIREKLCDK